MMTYIERMLERSEKTNNLLIDATIADLIMTESTDAYKQTHWMQYPSGTRKVYSYLESRGGKYNSTVFFGLQYYLKKYFAGNVITEETVDEAAKDMEEVFGFKYFNYDGWMKIATDLGGKLPIEIRAVPEGLNIPVHNTLMTVVNTDDRFPFLTNFFEGLLEMVWYPTTVATTSHEIKRMIKGYAMKSGQDVSIVHLNDFGFRGASSPETAGIGGMSHLINFSGTDTLVGIRYAKKYYNAQIEPPVGLSVYAAEHSTVTSWGENHEIDAYRHFLTTTPSEAILSIVIDSYDPIRAARDYLGGELKPLIMNRAGKVVFRPDSGDPIWMSTTVLDILWDKFGGTVNELGYRVLDPHVGMIYGDYIDYDMINNIMYEVVVKRRYAAQNIVFGMGGALLQKVNRDTQSFAFKASAIMDKNGNWNDIYKRPVSDARKASKKGRFSVIKDVGGITTVPYTNECDDDLLKVVFKNGVVINPTMFADVRKRADSDIT